MAQVVAQAEMATNSVLCEYASSSSDSSDDDQGFYSGVHVSPQNWRIPSSFGELLVPWRETYLEIDTSTMELKTSEAKRTPGHSSISSELSSQFAQNLEVSVKILRCKSFENFKSQLKRTLSTYHFLDPSLSRQFVKGKFDLDSSGMVMLQGALINAQANWEEFIVELIKEAFSVFIEVGSGNPPTLQCLKKSLPSCDQILKRELRQTCQTQPAEEIVFNLLMGVNSPQYSPSVNPWAEYFESYCQTTISGAQLVPIFSPGAPNSIDTLFTKLFQVTAGGSLSEQLLKIGRFRFKLRLNQDDEIDLQIHSVSALKNISRLYYALRCVFAHGHNQKTMTGALKDFPRNVAEFELGNERAAKYYLGLYRRMEKYGRETSISYLTFINMIEFLKRAAFFLMRALAKWVYDSTDTCIWSYKPHN